MWRPSYGARGFFAPTTLGFRLEDVRPPVALHHGDIDALVPLSMVATSRITRPTPSLPGRGPPSASGRAGKSPLRELAEPPCRYKGSSIGCSGTESCLRLSTRLGPDDLCRLEA